MGEFALDIKHELNSVCRAQVQFCFKLPKLYVTTTGHTWPVDFKLSNAFHKAVPKQKIADNLQPRGKGTCFLTNGSTNKLEFEP